MKTAVIEILQWEKYNPRKDYIHPWWFALGNKVTTDPMFSEFSDAEFRAWIHILCMASQANSGVVTLFFKHAERAAGIKPKILASAISKLEILEVIQVPAVICTDAVQDPFATEQYNTEQYRTEQNNATPVATLEIPRTKDLIALYCDLWKSRYNSTRSPDIRGKEVGQIKKLGEDLGFARASKLIEAYLQMPDAWFITRTHDVATLVTNLNKVSLFADSGKMVSQREARQIDDGNALVSQLRRLADK